VSIPARLTRTGGRPCVIQAGVALSMQKSPAEAGFEFSLCKAGGDPYFETNSHAPSSRYPTKEGRGTPPRGCAWSIAAADVVRFGSARGR